VEVGSEVGPLMPKALYSHSAREGARGPTEERAQLTDGATEGNRCESDHRRSITFSSPSNNISSSSAGPRAPSRAGWDRRLETDDSVRAQLELRSQIHAGESAHSRRDTLFCCLCHRLRQLLSRFHTYD
jgi:hypothetical protein